VHAIFETWKILRAIFLFLGVNTIQKLWLKSFSENYYKNCFTDLKSKQEMLYTDGRIELEFSRDHPHLICIWSSDHQHPLSLCFLMFSILTQVAVRVLIQFTRVNPEHKSKVGLEINREVSIVIARRSDDSLFFTLWHNKVFIPCVT